MNKKMIVGMHLGNGYGSQPGAWRMPGVDPRNYASFDAKVRYAQAAERGKMQFLFLPDGPGHVGDIENDAPHFNLKIANEGWVLRDILAHGVIDYHPVIVGPGVEAADHMQKWFEAGAADGFWVSPDIYEDGVDAFVDGVVPILEERGLFHREYEGSTLRDHLVAPAQYGLDARVTR